MDVGCVYIHTEPWLIRAASNISLGDELLPVTAPTSTAMERCTVGGILQTPHASKKLQEIIRSSADCVSVTFKATDEIERGRIPLESRDIYLHLVDAMREDHCWSAQMVESANRDMKNGDRRAHFSLLERSGAKEPFLATILNEAIDLLAKERQVGSESASSRAVRSVPTFHVHHENHPLVVAKAKFGRSEATLDDNQEQFTEFFCRLKTAVHNAASVILEQKPPALDARSTSLFGDAQAAFVQYEQAAQRYRQSLKTQYAQIHDQVRNILGLAVLALRALIPDLPNRLNSAISSSPDLSNSRSLGEVPHRFRFCYIDPEEDEVEAIMKELEKQVNMSR